MIGMLFKYFSFEEPNTYELRVEYKKKNQPKADYCIISEVVAQSASDAIKNSVNDFSQPKDDEIMILYVNRL